MESTASYGILLNLIQGVEPAVVSCALLWYSLTVTLSGGTVTKIGKRKSPSPPTVQHHSVHSQLLTTKGGTPSPRGVCDDYLRNAPDVLKSMHRRQASPAYGTLLHSLLTDPEMKPAWDELAERFKQVKAGLGLKGKRDKEKRRMEWLYKEDYLYERFWSQIKYAKSKSNLPIEPRSKIRQRFKLIALDALKLAEAVSEGPLVLSKGLVRLRGRSKRKGGYTPASAKSLNLLTYEFYPNEVATLAFQNHNWARLTSAERDCLAFRVLKDSSWPSIGELLVEFAERAFREAREIVSTSRVVDRRTKHSSINIFVRVLHERFFQRFLEATMAGTLARIASVVLNKEVSKSLVVETLSSGSTKAT